MGYLSPCSVQGSSLSKWLCAEQNGLKFVTGTLLPVQHISCRVHLVQSFSNPGNLDLQMSKLGLVNSATWLFDKNLTVLSGKWPNRGSMPLGSSYPNSLDMKMYVCAEAYMCGYCCFQNELTKAYRKLARKWHPDMHKSKVTALSGWESNFKKAL